MGRFSVSLPIHRKLSVSYVGMYVHVISRQNEFHFVTYTHVQ